MTSISRKVRALVRRAARRLPEAGTDEGLTLIELLVSIAVTAIIVPVIVLLIVTLVRANVNVANTMVGVRQDETAGEALVQYLHGTTVILPGSNATTLNASILDGYDQSSYEADTATLNATLDDSANPNLDGTFQTTLTPDGGSGARTVSTYDAINSTSVFTYYYNGSTGLTSTAAPTDSMLSEIVAVEVNVTFLAGPHVPAAGYQVRPTHFDTTVYLQNSSGDPAPGTTTTLSPPGNPVLNSPATVTAAVSPTPDGGTVTFTVSYGGTAENVCSTPVDVSTSTGKASCTFTPTASGSYSVSATYSGTSDFQPSTSTSATFVIPISTTTTLTVTPSSGALATSATVSPAPDGGTVMIYVPGHGGYPHGCSSSPSTVSLPVTSSDNTVTYNFTGLCNSTTYSVTATYSGSPDGLYAGSKDTGSGTP